MAKRETAKHRDAFEAWYDAGRNFTKVSNQLTVSRPSLYAWADAFNWHERADARDAESARIADEEAAKERAARQKRRRQAGELMSARGLEFFKKFEIDSARDAIQAIKAGTEIERKEDGVPDWVLMILNADSNQLDSIAKGIGISPAAPAEASGDVDSLSPESDAEDD